MKVAIICDVLGKPNNGTTIALTNLINYLKEHGHDVTVVCPDQDKKDEDGFAIVPEMKMTPIIARVFKANGIVIAKPDKKLLYEVIEDADVVHVEMCFPLGIAATNIAKKSGKPVTASFHMQAENLTAHAGLMNFKPANDLVYKWVYNELYKKVDAVHYPTRFIKETFENAVKDTSLNSYVISNGVNGIFFEKRDQVFPRLSDKFTILCSGRYSTEKAQQQLIKAATRSKHKDDIKIIFAGSGPKEKKLKRLCEKYGVDAQFGFYDREGLIAVQHAADLYVHTALIEIEALCCIESIVSGLVPVICNAKRSATPDFAIDENNLYAENDEKDLADKIDFWYEHPELIAEYKKAYRERISAFDQNACMQRMEQMLFDAVKRVKEKSDIA